MLGMAIRDNHRRLWLLFIQVCLLFVYYNFLYLHIWGWIGEQCAFACYLAYLRRTRPVKGRGQIFLSRISPARLGGWFPTTVICLIGGYLYRPLWWGLMVLVIVSFATGFISHWRIYQREYSTYLRR